MIKTYMGIDQSYKKCAYVIIGAGVFEFDIIVADSTKDIFGQALDISLKLYDTWFKHKPDYVHLEGLAFGMQGSATRDLAGLLFTIVTTLVHKDPNIIYKIIPPTSVKKFGTGSGKATKADMISSLPNNVLTEFTKKGFKKTTGLADLADAYWIATYS